MPALMQINIPCLRTEESGVKLKVQLAQYSFTQKQTSITSIKIVVRTEQTYNAAIHGK